MKPNKITYFHSKIHEIEIVYCKDSKVAYPEHNHSSNYVIGLVLNGKIQLTHANTLKLISKNDFFLILPYEPHMIQSPYGQYTMVSILVCCSSIAIGGFFI